MKQIDNNTLIKIIKASTGKNTTDIANDLMLEFGQFFAQVSQQIMTDYANYIIDHTFSGVDEKIKRALSETMASATYNVYSYSHEFALRMYIEQLFIKSFVISLDVIKDINELTPEQLEKLVQNFKDSIQLIIPQTEELVHLNEFTHVL